jgi:hypothetical protein
MYSVMKKSLLMLLAVILGAGLYGFKTYNQQVIPVGTPFPQTGEITVYKYKMFKKEEIGKLIWVARTERKYNSQKDNYYSEINITVENKTSEYVEFSFDFTGVQNEGVSGEVSPHGTWRSGAKLSSEDCTGVEPTKKEITIS